MNFEKTASLTALIARGTMGALLMALSACGGGGSPSSPTTQSPPSTYTIGGTVSGLSGSGLVLQNNAGDSLTIAKNGSFVFTTAEADGAAYAVTVATEPASPGQVCTASNSSGTIAGANVSNVSIICVTVTHTVSATVSGLAGSGLVLQLNASSNLNVTTNGSVTFATPLPQGAAYAVTVFAEPTAPSQSCSVMNGTGTVDTADITNVSIGCITVTETIGGTVTGLDATGLVLQLNGGSNLPLSTNGAFLFAAVVSSGSSYAVSIATQPSTESCSIANASGIATSDVSNIGVSCTTIGTYTVGGSLHGLSSVGLVLAIGSTSVAPAPTATSFTLPVSLPSGSSYEVTVQNQPAGQDCQASNASGTITFSNVTNVAVGCVSGQWTWTTGASTPGTLPVYGTLGLPSAANTPGSRVGAYTWTDAAGNLWLFGGQGRASGSLYDAFSDLWKYAPATNQWTWVSGAQGSGASGVYGTKGHAAPTNDPGAREFGYAWTDAGGNFWLFGGLGYDAVGTEGYLNDLWVYSPTTGLWTWVSGSTTWGAGSVYGTKGTAAASNIPGARENGVSWIDAQGNLWLFGGEGFTGIANSQCGLYGCSATFGDLWTYSPSTGLWTFVAGSTTPDAAGIYGTQGLSAAGNSPGARIGASTWTDNAGHLWLFGGEGYDSLGADDPLNDLWQYNPTAGTWTWVSGSNLSNSEGQLGVLGVAGAGNTPGAWLQPSTWKDTAGNLWLYAGGLWQFNPSTQLWTREGGEPSAVYGTQGVGAATNYPGVLAAGSAWTDAAGHFWLFGGYGDPQVGATMDQDQLNDMWEFTP